MSENTYHRVQVPGVDAKLSLLELSGREGLSQLVEYELTFSSSDDELQVDDLLGQPLALSLGVVGERARSIHGYITAFSAIGRASDRQACYRLSLRPWLWFLTQSRRQRIFQNLTLKQVLDEVFSDYPASIDWQAECPESMEYCVQFGESDFAFFSRLLEDAGLYYFFVHQPDDHLLVIADSMSAHKPVQHLREMTYRPNQDRVPGSMLSWESHGELRPGAFSLVDFDFTKASNREASVLSASHGAAATARHGNYRQEDFPGRFSRRESGETLARIQLEAAHARQQWRRGVSQSPYLAAGQCFTLVDHPRAEQNSDYLIVAATLQFEASTELRCEVEAIPTTQVFRAPIQTARPLIAGPQTAFVVGKEGDPIWVDEYGRIKVQFHWDSSGRRNEACSCWVRVAQPMAGKRWGALFLPRVGQEVVVEFLGGDPDRPLVTAGLYNAGQRPPWELPVQAARSGLKSQSLGEPDVYNELRFDDKKGREQLLIHAGRNQDLTVRNDAFASIGNDWHLTVGANQFLKVEDDLHESVGGQRNTRVDADQSLDIGGDSHCRIAGQWLSTAADMDFKANGKLVLEAGKSLTLKVGSSTLVLSAAGVAINGKTVTLDGSASVDINGGAAAASTSAKAAAPAKAKPPKEADDGRD
ncbi:MULTISPECIES: type VI secretion system Vgr family protein [unclassified Pseudomonas]|uniref:type VI secretion system Vgr family protein n=1 Tax=unclassified Pseudomonas TaxID=196821 RepID=UPI000C2FAF38|nr:MULTISPECIES: type VI secretion system tip protein TssI/VgrG [unclassified Pseudomonas]MCU1736069.1 type VI secretion system tip protein VgrG [Pseudomonas sp. 20S_6.2_Bac1]